MRRRGAGWSEDGAEDGLASVFTAFDTSPSATVMCFILVYVFIGGVYRWCVSNKSNVIRVISDERWRL